MHVGWFTVLSKVTPEGTPIVQTCKRTDVCVSCKGRRYGTLEVLVFSAHSLTLETSDYRAALFPLP